MDWNTNKSEKNIHDVNYNVANVFCFMPIMKHYFHYQIKIMKLQSVLVDCCVIENSSIQSAAMALFIWKKTHSPPSSMTVFVVNYWQQQKNHCPPTALIYLYSIDCCSFVAALGKMTRNRVLWNWQNKNKKKTHCFFTPKYTPCLLI